MAVAGLPLDDSRMRSPTLVFALLFLLQAGCDSPGEVSMEAVDAFVATEAEARDAFFRTDSGAADAAAAGRNWASGSGDWLSNLSSQLDSLDGFGADDASNPFATSPPPEDNLAPTGNEVTT